MSMNVIPGVKQIRLHIDNPVMIVRYAAVGSGPRWRRYGDNELSYSVSFLHVFEEQTNSRAYPWCLKSGDEPGVCGARTTEMLCYIIPAQAEAHGEPHAIHFQNETLVYAAVLSWSKPARYVIFASTEADRCWCIHLKTRSPKRSHRELPSSEGPQGCAGNPSELAA